MLGQVGCLSLKGAFVRSLHVRRQFLICPLRLDNKPSSCPSVRPSVRSPSLVLLDDPIGTSNTEYICICTYWRYGKSPIVSAVSLCTWMTCTYTSTMMMCPCREWGECAALGGEDRSKDYSYSGCKYIELFLHCSSTSWTPS